MMLNLLTLDALTLFSVLDTLLLAYIAWQVTPKKGGRK